MAGPSTGYLEWTDNHWKEWIADRLDERRGVFRSDPDELVASYNRETSSARGYTGREILELIQNADDAGSDSNEPNRMAILLTPEALFAANTGVPFSPEGIKSLMISDNSPKQLQRTRCIGYKGLGFRSVLGWSSNILVSSGKLTIGFSRNRAIAWLRDLVSIDQNVAIKVNAAVVAGLTNPVPTLAVPFWFEDSAQHEAIGPDILSEVWKLRNRGYNTVIVLKFDDPRTAHKHIQDQLDLIAAETLLFLQHLQELEIQSPRKEMKLHVERKNDLVIFNTEGGTPESRQVLLETNTLPSEFWRSEHPLLTQYEIKIALGITRSQTNRLFVYFPTEALFPFPSVAHATLELTENRQHLVESPANQWIARRLARVMVDAAQADANSSKPWSALLAVTARGDIDAVLQKLGFEKVLREEIRGHRLLPVRNGEFETPLAAKRIRGNFDQLLEGELFSDMCLHTTDDRISTLLDDLGVQFIASDELKKRLDDYSRRGITLDKRADIIHQLVSNNLVSSGAQPELLVDEDNDIIQIGSRPFLPPEGKAFALPKWVPLKMIHSELASKLKEKFGLKNVRELTTSLSAFDVQQYSLIPVVSSIVAEANRRARASPDDELSIRREMIQTIWTVFSTIEPGSELPAVPADLNIILPTRKGDFVPSRTLYIGGEYPGGALLESLYGRLGGPFVAHQDLLGIRGDANRVKVFLVWLGVAEYPREVRQIVRPEHFMNYVLDQIPFPVEFEDIIVHRKEEFGTLGGRIADATVVDRLKEILETADPHAVIAWLVQNRARLDSWRTSGDSGARLAIHPSGRWYSRKSEVAIPSFVLWLLRTTEWIPIQDGTKRTALRCTFARGVSRELSAFIGQPALSLEHPLLKTLGTDPTMLRTVLASIGVITDLDELPWESFYGILLELPTKDPEGQVARSIYRALVARSDSENPFGETYRTFKAQGKMWGSIQGKSSYILTKELFYLENQTLPESASRLFPLLELDRRRGASKVNRLFGVKPLNESERKISVTQHEEHAFSSEFAAEVDALKPYIYSLRVEEDSKRTELRRIRDLTIKLCRSAKGFVRVGDKDVDATLLPGDSLVVNSTAYIISEPGDYGESLIKDEIIADALGEIFGTIVEVDIGSDVARLATCAPARRSFLLNKITGGAGVARLEKARSFFESSQFLAEEEFVGSPVPQAPTYTPSTGTTDDATPTEHPSTHAFPSPLVGPVTVSEGQPLQIARTRRVSSRVIVNVRQGTTDIFSRPRVNPDRSQSLAEQFEVAQGRHPLAVSHFQGSEAYGCDILSFETESRIDSFKQTLDKKLVSRFIEVKGSVNASGGIVLKGNELDCAQTNRDRYFIYRIFESATIGEFELVEVRNPLELDRPALERQVEVNPFRTTRSVRYGVSEIHEEEIAETSTSKVESTAAPGS